MNKSKKIISIVAAATLAFSTLALSACGTEEYKGTATTYTAPKTAAVSNGGFAVEHGDYVYFINGSATNTDDNVYGDVVKGALMRITKAQLAAGQYSAAQTVVPSLFVAGDYTSGIYIYGDYVYYATPTTDKDKDGQVANTSIDFKRAKLDCKEAPMGGKNDHFFRLTTNTAKYRYVQDKVSGVVYCLYEEDSKLKSYNTATGITTVLVSGASSFFYDTNDLTNPNVYYTMSVKYDVDKATSTDAQYNQIYCVNAANTATTDAAEAKYTVYSGGKAIKSYDFDVTSLNKKNQEAKDNDQDEPYDLDDYATYPYVNLGQLVLDGVGFASNVEDMRFNEDITSFNKADKLSGYTYTIQQQTNGGVYFTRKGNPSTSNDPNYLYYLSNAATSAAEWNTVTGNQSVETVSKDTTAASAKALYAIDNGVHSYIYVDGTTIKKATATATTTIAYNVASDITLWQTSGEYLYYYGAGTNGKNLIRLNYTGTQADYDYLGDEEAYAPVTVDLVDWSDSWYKPELIDANGKTILLYPNAQSYGAGSTAYNYIYAAELGDIVARNEEIAKVNEYIDDYSDNSQLQAVMKYYFRTGKTTAFDAVKGEDKGLYNDYQREQFDVFKAKFTEGEFKQESKFISLIGAMTTEDSEAIDTAWADSLLKEKVEEEDDSLPTWAIVLIIVAGVLVLATAITVPTIIMVKKQKAEKERQDSIVNAFDKKLKKIDTTDDKSIDVYAEEEPAEAPAEESVEAPVEETAEPVEFVEEAAPVEEVPAEEMPVEENAAEAVEEAPVEAVTEEAPVEEVKTSEEVAPAPVEEAPAEENKAEVTPEKEADKE